MRITLRDGRLPLLATRRLILRDIRQEDVSEAYVAWLNDPQVTQYLESRHTPQTEEAVRAFVQSRLDDTRDNWHFGVYDKGGRRLVGTTTVHHFNPVHGYASISFIIGHPHAAGQGYATESVHGACAYALLHKGLHKLVSGHYTDNEASARVLLKNGFSQEGLQKELLVTAEGRRTDLVLYGLLARDFRLNPEWAGSGPLEALQEDA